MLWEKLERDDWNYYGEEPEAQGGEEPETPFGFDFLSLLCQPKDYYRILEVDYDATEETIRSNYIRLALKWHPDKRKDDDIATSRFQEINEAYKGISQSSQELDFDMQRPWNSVFIMVTREGSVDLVVYPLDTMCLRQGSSRNYGHDNCCSCRSHVVDSDASNLNEIACIGTEGCVGMYRLHPPERWLNTC